MSDYLVTDLNKKNISYLFHNVTIIKHVKFLVVYFRIFLFRIFLFLLLSQ